MVAIWSTGDLHSTGGTKGLNKASIYDFDAQNVVPDVSGM